jgi:hypothetical protein
MCRTNHHKKSWIEKRPSILLLLVVSILAGFSGCGSSKKDAQALVKAGSETSDKLAKYYDSLVNQESHRYDLLDYSAGIQFSDSEKKEIAKERGAYASRAQLARKLKATYDALGNLIDYDASTEVKGAVGELMTTVLKQVPHPEVLDADLFKTVVGKIAGKLAEIQQEKQFRKNAPRVLEVLDGVGAIFELERPLYAQTISQFEHETALYAVGTLGSLYCGTAETTGIGVLEKFLEPYGLKYYPVATTNGAKCEQNYEFFKRQILRIEHDRRAAASDQARSLSQVLYSLQRTHRDFLHVKAEAPLLVAGDLVDVSKLVASLKQAITARDTWEQQHPAQTNNGAEDGPSYAPEQNFLSDHVVTLLSPPIKEILKKGEDTTSAAFRQMLLADLNRIIEDDDIPEALLSKDEHENLDKYRTFVLVYDREAHSTRASNEERKGYRNHFIDDVSAKLAADRRQFTGSAGPVPVDLQSRIGRDPAAKALARLNRAILAYVYEGTIPPAP